MLGKLGRKLREVKLVVSEERVIKGQVRHERGRQ